MSEPNITLLRAVTKKAIQDYAQMASTAEPPPESFIRDVCAMEIHQRNRWNVRIEFPARDTADWGVDRSSLKFLSKNFLIDLVCFETAGNKSLDLKLLVEFKLWADVTKVKHDIERLLELTKIANATNSASQFARGYVVCAPHYPDLKSVKDTITNFEKHFRFGPENSETFLIDEENGAAAGIIVLDVHDCQRLNPQNG